MHSTDRTANLLGAAALAVSDRMLAGSTGAAGVSASGAAALVVCHGAPGLSVTELGKRIGLSQSAAARMVDSLESGGMVQRRPGRGRWVSVHLTAAGTRAAGKLLDARAESLRDVLAGLDAGDREALTGLLAKLLTRLYEAVGSSELVCRLCDRQACTTDAACPVGEAARHAGG